jgi:hypothetical protein
MGKSQNLFTYFLLMAIVDVAIMVTAQFPIRLAFPVSYLFSVPFVVGSIVEINSSHKLYKNEKTSWTLGFVLTPLIAGILYFLSSRKKILLN